ncbi:MAG: hypothetical protein FJW77_02140 [Actinobacteria bacterium]|nr:hypothetical protein [Actinomycetota bacterium]
MTTTPRSPDARARRRRARRVPRAHRPDRRRRPRRSGRRGRGRRRGRGDRDPRRLRDRRADHTADHPRVRRVQRRDPLRPPRPRRCDRTGVERVRLGPCGTRRDRMDRRGAVDAQIQGGGCPRRW